LGSQLFTPKTLGIPTILLKNPWDPNLLRIKLWNRNRWGAKDRRAENFSRNPQIPNSLVGKGLNDSNSRANPLEFPESEADFARQPGGFSGKCPGRRSNSARIAEISSSSAATGIAGLIEIIGRSPNLKKI
jgi:hypothetical protein